MADDMLRILISATLDVQKSTVTINEQLKQLNSKMGSVKVNVDTRQLQQSAKDYVKWWDQTLKQIEQLDKTHYIALQQNKERDNKLKQQQDKDYVNWWSSQLKAIEDLDKAHYQAINEDQKRAAAIQKQTDQEQIQRTKNINKLLETQGNNTMSLSSKMKEMAISIPLWFVGMTAFMQVIHAVTDGFQGMIDIEAKMAGYVQTNEAYFDSQQKINDEASKFIQTTHELGASIDNVTESARLWGRMYKDVNVVQELVRQSTKLSTVDLVSLADSTKMMEAVLAQYGAQIKNANDAQLNGNRILDAWSSVAHNTMAPAKDLGQAFEKTGKIADETGVSFDFMNGLISAGIRNTALSGQNLGNMWKTVLGTIRTDKAVNEIERLGVATKEVVNGQEQWRKAEDILLDLSVKVIGKNEDLTKSYEDISRGVYQFAKLAASLNVGDILIGTAASINSTGSTTEYLVTQMDTIARKSAQVKASMLDLFNTAGNDGLRNSIKGILDVLDQLIIGFTKVPSIVYESVAAFGALFVLYKNVIAPVTNLIELQKMLNTAIQMYTTYTTVETEAVLAQTSAMRAAALSTALWTGGITLAIAAIGGIVYWLGAQEEAQRKAEQATKDQISAEEQSVQQKQRQIEFLGKLVEAHTQLAKQYDSLTEAAKTDTNAAEKQIEIKNQLGKVSQALAITVGKEGAAMVEAANWSAAAIQTQINAIKDAQKVADETKTKLLNTQIDQLNKQISEKQKEVNQYQQQSDTVARREGKPKKGVLFDAGAEFDAAEKKAYDDKKNEAQRELDKLNNDLAQAKLEQSQLQLTDALAGKDGKVQGEDSATIKKNFDDQMAAFQHNVNMQADGYKTAQEQLARLQEIKKQYKDSLTDQDLYGIDEEIYRAQNDIAAKAKGFPSGSSAPVVPLDQTDKYNIINPYQRQLDSVDASLKESQAKQANYVDTSKEFRDELQKQIDLYRQKQNIVHNEADDLRDSNIELQKRLDTEKLSTQQRNELLKQLDDNKNKISDLSTEWFNYEKSANDANKNITDSLKKEVDDRFDFSKNWIDEQKALNKLSLQDELDAWERVVQNHKDDENDLAQIREENAQKRIEAEKEVARVQQELTKQQEDEAKTKLDNAKSVAKDIVDAYKAAYEAQKDAELDGIQAQMDAEEKRHKQKQDNLDAELKQYEDSINIITQSIDRQSETDDFNANLSKAQKEAQDIQDQISQYKLDNSIEGQAKQKELEKEYADKEDEIQKLQSDRTKTLRKDSLQDLLDKKKKEVDAAKKSEDAQYNATKEALDKTKDAREKYWQGIIDNDAKYQQIQDNIIAGHFDNIKNEMEGFKTDIASKAQIIGEQIDQNIINKLNTAMTTLGNFGNNPYGSKDDNFTKPAQSNSGYYIPVDDNEKRIIDMMKKNSIAANNTSDQNVISQLHQSNQGWASLLGSGISYNNGTWYKNNLPLFHNGGVVGETGTSQQKWWQKMLGLSNGEVPLIAKAGEVILSNPMQFINEITSKMIGSVSINKPISAPSGSSVNNFHFHIANVSGGKEGADTLYTEYKKGIQTGRYK